MHKLSSLFPSLSHHRTCRSAYGGLICFQRVSNRVVIKATYKAFACEDVYGQLVRLLRLSIRFLFVRPRFRYCFFSPKRRRLKLASRFRVRRQLRPLWTFTTDVWHARHTTKKAVSSLPPDTAFHYLTDQCESATRFDLFEEVITLVIYQDKRGEVLYLDLPDRFHTQFRIFHALDALDIVLSQDSRRAADRS